MNSDDFKKIYYIFLSFFIILLMASYENIASGGSILYSNIYSYFILLPLVTVVLIYFLMNSKIIKKMDILMVFLFCMAMSLVFVVSTGKFPFDLDSIISIHSIDFISSNGFSTHLVNQNLIIHATYSLPGLSILSDILMLILNLTSLKIAKLLPLVLTSLFFLVFFVFINKIFDKKTSLISLLLIYSFYPIMTLGGQFANVVLAFPFLILSWYFLYKSNKTSGWVLLQILVLLAFVITHHLTFLIFVISLVLLQIFYYLFNKNQSSNSIFVNIVLLSGVLMLTYYVFIYFGPLETVINSFTNHLLVEGKSVTSPNSWDLNIMLQRFSWVVFLAFSVVLFLNEIKKRSLKKVLTMNYSLFLFVGGSIFVLSLFTLLLHAPFNWDRIAIFGWLLFIPATISIALKLESKKIRQFSLVLVSLLLIFGNIYTLSPNYLDHSGDNKYHGDFKNWVEDQEYNSVLWLIKNEKSQDLVIGDDVITRIYLSNSKDFKGHTSLITDNYGKNNTNNQGYAFIRKENFYRILNGFYPAKGTSFKQSHISNTSYKAMDSNLNLIYDNEEIKVFANFK